MALVSVIVPIYNVEKYLDECVQSILSQSFKDFEVILVDDGSTDGSGAVCDSFCLKDSRVRVRHKLNGGVVSARKCGVKLSQGKYIMFVDGDDYVKENLLESLYKAICENNSDVAVSGYAVKYPNGKEDFYTFKYKGGFYDREAIENELFDTILYKCSEKSFGLGHMAWAKLFRREVLENSCMFEIDDRIRVGEDVALCSDVFFTMQSLVILPENLYYYRMAESSMTKNYDSRFLQRIHILIEFVRKTACRRLKSQEKLDIYLNQLNYYTVMLYVQGIRNACEKSDIGFAGCLKIVRHALKKDEIFSQALKKVKSGFFGRDVFLWVCALKAHFYIFTVMLSRLSRLRRKFKRKFSQGEMR